MSAPKGTTIRTLALHASGPIGQRARWLLVAIHLPFVAFAGTQVVTGIGGFGAPQHGWIGLAFVLAAAVLQLRHSISAAAGTKPRGWRWTFALLLLLSYGLLPFFGARVVMLQWFVIASVAMLLPVALAMPAALGVLLGWALTDLAALPDWSPSQLTVRFVYLTTVLAMGGGAIYAAARLVQIIAELHETRARLGDAAMERERLRVSRDLHDLLGQSLSAVSLKADLALALLNRGQVNKAVVEAEGLIALASASLDDIGRIPHSEPPASLSTELDRASELLAARGIALELEILVGWISRAATDVFGWAVREGVTNVLRHSAAKVCRISARAVGSAVVLRVENDGVLSLPRQAEDSSGLAGLAARAAASGGTARGEARGNGTFVLEVAMPEERE